LSIYIIILITIIRGNLRAFYHYESTMNTNIVAPTDTQRYHYIQYNI